MDGIMIAKRNAPTDSWRVWKVQSLLDRLVPQENCGKGREARVEADHRPDRLKYLFLRLYKTGDRTRHGYRLKELYDAAFAAAKQVKPTAGEIELFSASIGKYYGKKGFAAKAGYFLSALINSSEEQEFTIRTEGIEPRLMYLGLWNNGKAITVKGDAGGGCGYEMKSGHITVEGDCGDVMGVREGTITVMGNLAPLEKRRWVYGMADIFQRGRKLVSSGIVLSDPANE